ncbi:hypothetical protein DPMN_062231 [Dreissena polymorpha]|uniref:Uncharacterized protein n=1 Tax=Dreissena polymorpha TaxID=45954 RepID=A0A9D4C9H0_DREPO|nr:hypothetical protein DPMN_062231 [Dreissena polymorpha]
MQNVEIGHSCLKHLCTKSPNNSGDFFPGDHHQRQPGELCQCLCGDHEDCTVRVTGPCQGVSSIANLWKPLKTYLLKRLMSCVGDVKNGFTVGIELVTSRSLVGDHFQYATATYDWKLLL